MKKTAVIFLSVFLFSYAPAVQYTHLVKLEKQKNPGDPIAVFQQYEKLPPNALIIGRISIGDTGFSTGCDYNTVLTLAQDKARQEGGVMR